jgi:ubiquinone/menaquinone biosynthesis C-methylase UbiE
MTNSAEEDDETESSYGGTEYSSSVWSDDTVAGDTWGPDGYIELPNVRFVEKDILDGVDAPDNYFDVIHCRFVFGVAMQADKVPLAIKEMARVLKPGGLLLLVESSVPFSISDGTPLPEGSAFSEAYEASRAAVREMGVDPDMNLLIEGLVRQTDDFSEQEAKYVPLPLGPWPEDPRLRELGHVGLACIRAGIRSIIPILRQSGYDDGRLSWLMARLDKEFDEQKVAKAGLSWHCTHLWARKKGWLID